MSSRTKVKEHARTTKKSGRTTVTRHTRRNRGSKKASIRLNQAMIMSMWDTEKDEYGYPIENITTQTVMELFDTNYRATNSLLKRMVADGKLESFKDGRLIYYFPVEKPKISPKDAWNKLLTHANRIDHKILNTIAERDGGKHANTGKSGKRFSGNKFQYMLAIDVFADMGVFDFDPDERE